MTFSLGANIFWTTVPDPLMNKVPVPSASCRAIPMPPQQQVKQLQSQSTFSDTSP